ncbi:hypothetical protein QYE76_016860 [Lolium multiflorum]|uniref:Retrotransposon gag domain-containing protein n=1 Tax=Lolium multiflorum TaxID=4521 RepID=A0AAD8QI32_LOLMU|nr:hypothetical protein QYE76_016860 [Lolium multiflorum]
MSIVGRRRVDDSDVRRRIIVRTAVTANRSTGCGKDRRSPRSAPPIDASPSLADGASFPIDNVTRTSPSIAGGLGRSPTPYLRRQHALLSPEKKKNHGHGPTNPQRHPRCHDATAADDDGEVERAERQANITALQQIAQNNNGHGNHDHPGSKLKNFQHTNPPMFNKTEEPLDADDWLQTMENNLEVAGVEAAEKVLFATHYLSGPARAWWTSARAMNAGQMMTWEDFKLKFSKYHVPQGLIKKMRDEFRELKQGRMSVVESLRQVSHSVKVRPG